MQVGTSQDAPFGESVATIESMMSNLTSE